MKNSVVLATVIMAIVGTGSIVGTTDGFGILTNPSSSTNVQQTPFEGHVTIVAKHADGTVYAYRQSDNTVTIYGKTCASVLIFGTNSTQCGGNTSTDKFQYVAVGTSNNPESDTSVYLGSEIVRAIKTQGGTTNATSGGHAFADVVSLITIGNATGGASLNEAGLFDAALAHQGHMFARKLISPAIAVNNGDLVNVKWTITIG